MPIQDDLRLIADRAHRELDSVHDFFEHSKIVWRSFQILVGEGHRVSAENLATGTRIDQDGLIRLAPQYTRDYLSTFTFRQFVSAFEVFLFNFLSRLLLHNPWQFARSQLEFEVVLKFKIDPTRSGDVLLDVLGEEFNGVLGCDYFSAYRRYLRECNAVVQFCLAHLIRDVKFLTTLPDARDRAYGERLREGLRALFGVIHRRAELGPRVFQRQLRAARDEVLRLATSAVSPTAHSQNMAKRFEKHGQAYFEFVTTPEVEPTNNLAEQAIRFVVIDRHITQGTRGETGRRWCARIWTVLATCAQQGRSVFEYLHAAVTAFFQQTAVPSLLSEVQ